jgi:type I restriction enzyme, S subunit
MTNTTTTIGPQTIDKQLPKGWQETIMQELVDITSSKRIFHSDYLDNGVPFYRSKEIIEKQAGNDISTDLHISEEKFNEIHNKFGSPIAGDVLLTSVGTLGIPYVVKNGERFYFKDGNLTWFRNFSSLDSTFFYYWILSPAGKESLNSITIGSTQSALTIDGLKSMTINLPPLPTQRRIAEILSCLDCKINLLRKQNKTLEATAQTLFKRWFVEFNFPNDNSEPYKESGGKMVESKLGMVPKMWKAEPLEKILDLQGGFVHDTKASGKPVSKIAKMGVVDGRNWFNHNSVIDYSEPIDNKYKLREDDLIVCTRDVTRDKVVIGNVAIIPSDLALKNLYAGSNTWIIKTKYNSYWLFLLLRDGKFRSHIIQSSKGSTIVMITRDAFLKCNNVLPDEEILDAFIEKIKPIFLKIKKNHSQIQTLTNLRDTLLPRLINGEITVQ